MPAWYDKFTRPGRSNRSATHGQDVHLPAAGKKKSPNLMESFGKAGKGFSKLRELTNKSRSASKR